MDKKMKKLVKTFFSPKKMKMSDFTFEWRVCRYRPCDEEAISRDLDACGCDLDVLGASKLSKKKEEECKAKVRAIFAKHTKRWNVYSLNRYCVEQTEIVKALAYATKNDKPLLEKFKTSYNYKLLQQLSQAENKKNRVFSSIAAMDRYVKKHNLGIDVYKMFEDYNAKQKANKKTA